jgi:hypothetical protein
MDNELSADEKLEVEAFLLTHPDLQAEMDILLSTKLPLEEMSFSGKEELLSQQMKMETVDENLLLYIDDELNAEQKSNIKEQLKTDKVYQQEHTLLMKTKLDASEVIPYPNKKELYRTTEKVFAIRAWMRIAAAVIIILFATAFFLIYSSTSNIPPVVAENNTPKKIQVIKETQKNIPSPVNRDENLVAYEQQVKKQAPKHVEDLVTEPVKRTLDNSVAQKEVTSKDKKEIQVEIIQPTTPDKEVAINIPSFNNPINKLPVTNETAVAYNITEDPTESAATEGNENKNRKGSFKGLLRKATRLIERNTGIGAANEDDELLIGVVALKLK